MSLNISIVLLLLSILALIVLAVIILNDFKNKAVKQAITDSTSSLRGHLGLDFISRRDHLKDTFPSAYRFLCYPKITSRTGLWMGTAVNAHLYLDNKFLAYIKLKSQSLVFSPRYNNRIAHGTSDQSKLLFPNLINQIVQKLGGFEKGWAKRYPNRTLEIFEKAPNTFFDELISIVEKLN